MFSSNKIIGDGKKISILIVASSRLKEKASVAFDLEVKTPHPKLESLGLCSHQSKQWCVSVQNLRGRVIEG